MDFDFAILSEQRSGTTFLCDLLNTHPGILCLKEIFNRNTIGFGLPGIGARIGFAPGDVARRDADPAAFLAALRGQAGDRLFGFKIFRPQTRAVLEAARAADRPKIVLTRNPLAVYSSVVAARESRVWHNPETPDRTVKIDFDREAFLARARRSAAFFETCRRGRFLDLDYDDLFAPDTEKTLADFLGVPVRFNRAALSTARVLAPDIPGRFADPDAVRRALAGTEFATLTAGF